LGRRSAEEIKTDFLGWVGNRDERRPFFAFLNFYDAHEPYLPPAPYDTLFGPRQPRHNPFHVSDYSWSPAEVQAEMDAYDGAIAYLDNQLGRLFADLEQRGILDNTLVILTGDHGEEFQEHGIMDHGFSLYLPVIHVPLLVRFPARVPSGMRVTTSVSLRDLTATILDVIGAEANSYFPGRSLARHWGKDGGTDLVVSEVRFLPGYPQYYPVSRGDVKSLMQDPYHYIHCGDGHEELYDSFGDPWEKTDLSQTEQGKLLISRFRNSLEQFAVRQNRA
jgi:arylsulfatase A-like enzyme